MKLRPLSNWALIRPQAAQEKSAGGIFIPDVAKEKPAEGTVIAVGEGRFEEEKDAAGKVKDRKFVKTTVRPGTRVLYEKYAGTTVTLDGEDLVMVRESSVLGEFA